MQPIIFIFHESFILNLLNYNFFLMTHIFYEKKNNFRYSDYKKYRIVNRKQNSALRKLDLS
jgi:hypothetical protein